MTVTSIRHFEQSRLLMGTLVSIEVVGPGSETKRRDAAACAFETMGLVEAACSRFDESSALRALCRRPGEWRQVPDVLFEAIRVAVEMSELTNGLFDPTVGATLVRHGFTRHYLTGEATGGLRTQEGATFRDIALDEASRSVYLAKPLLLDLGAVAKGLAIDLAAAALEGWEGFAINAGGDVYVHGVDRTGQAWQVRIQDPAAKDGVIASVQGGDMAVCTSGNYERRSPLDPGVHHLIRADTGQLANDLVSCTVIAPLAMLADVVSTAAYLLGAGRALGFVDDAELAALCVDDALAVTMNESMRGYLQ